MLNMVQQIAVAVFVFSLFGTGDLAGTPLPWTNPNITNGKATIAKVLKEDAVNGTIVITLNATGADSYKITKQTTDGMFAVANKGALTLANNALIDYETTRSYTLTVIASNTANRTSSAPAVLTINVGDVNDNTPQFDKAEYSKTISNNTEKGKELITVHATDKDITVAFKTLQYTITGDIGNFFEIGSTDGKIKTKKIVTVSKVTTYNLTVHAEDNSGSSGGTPKLSGTTTVKICVGCPDSGAGHTAAFAIVMSLAVLLALQF